MPDAAGNVVLPRDVLLRLLDFAPAAAARCPAAGNGYLQGCACHHAACAGPLGWGAPLQAPAWGAPPPRTTAAVDTTSLQHEMLRIQAVRLTSTNPSLNTLSTT